MKKKKSLFIYSQKFLTTAAVLTVITLITATVIIAPVILSNTNNKLNQQKRDVLSTEDYLSTSPTSKNANDSNIDAAQSGSKEALPPTDNTQNYTDTGSVNPAQLPVYNNIYDRYFKCENISTAKDAISSFIKTQNYTLLDISSYKFDSTNNNIFTMTDYSKDGGLIVYMLRSSNIESVKIAIENLTAFSNSIEGMTITERGPVPYATQSQPVTSYNDGKSTPGSYPIQTAFPEKIVDPEPYPMPNIAPDYDLGNDASGSATTGFGSSSSGSTSTAQAFIYWTFTLYNK